MPTWGVAQSDTPSPGFTTLRSSSDSTIGFYGATPVAQASTIASVATTAATTSTPWGYSTSTQADAVVTALNSVITALKNIGIVATS